MIPKAKLLAGTGLAVPLLIPALAGAAPQTANETSPIPLAESQLDGVTAGAVTDSAVLCLACRVKPPRGWTPRPYPPIKYPTPPIVTPPPISPPEVTTMAVGEEGGIYPLPGSISIAPPQ